MSMPPLNSTEYTYSTLDVVQLGNRHCRKRLGGVARVQLIRTLASLPYAGWIRIFSPAWASPGSHDESSLHRRKGIQVTMLTKLGSSRQLRSLRCRLRSDGYFLLWRRGCNGFVLASSFEITRVFFREILLLSRIIVKSNLVVVLYSVAEVMNGWRKKTSL